MDITFHNKECFQMSDLKCPICSRDMKTFVRDGVEVDQCITCGGIWLDSGELQKLVGVEPEMPRILECPKCQKPMSIQILRGVELDHCPSCGGIALDRGELDELSNPVVDEFRGWLDLTRNVELAKDPVGEMASDLLDQVFVMAQSGVLVASCVPKDSIGLDEDLLAGMLMAIQDFVTTAFTNMSSGLLNSINVGEKRLLLERGDYLMIASVVAGNPQMAEKYRQRMKKDIKDMEARYGKDLEHWDGDLDKLKELRSDIACIFTG